MSKILIAGDFCPSARVADLIENNRATDILSDFIPYISDSDYSIVNLECPIVKDSGTAKPIDKVGPNLKCTPKTIKFLQDNHFNCVTLANNHIFDYGQQGIEDTIDSLENHGIEYIGAGKSIEDLKPIIYPTIGDMKFAIISACENEFSIADDSHGGSFESDFISLYYLIKEARSKSVDKIIVILHGGKEFYALPSPQMKKAYRFLIDVGADVVINHHQHCYSGYEEYSNGLIFYGLGNFCFDLPHKVDSVWYYGFALELNFTKDNMAYKLLPYSQCLESPSVRILDQKDRLSFESDIAHKNKIISDDFELDRQYRLYLNKNISAMSLSPFTGGILWKLAWHNIIPNLVSKSYLRNIGNILRCRSHREDFITWINNNKNLDAK